MPFRHRCTAAPQVKLVTHIVAYPESNANAYSSPGAYHTGANRKPSHRSYKGSDTTRLDVYYCRHSNLNPPAQAETQSN